MLYADFLNDLNDPDSRRWRLTNWSHAVHLSLGGRGLLAFRGTFAALFAPTGLLALYSLWANRPTLLILVVLSLWGFWASSPGPTGIGMAASLLVALVGLIVSVLLQDSLFLYASLLPGATWFGSCAILGTTASHLNDALRTSEDLFQNFLSRGILMRTEVAERTPPEVIDSPAGSQP